MAENTRAVKGTNMEGAIARWYAKNTASNLDGFRREAAALAAKLPAGAAVLEVAPGPGYLAIELAKRGNFRIAAVDYSHTFIAICRENARAAGVEIDFRQGDAAHLPFPDQQFDFIICRAAFKNFGDPAGALAEMHRVLKPGGTALIEDMRKDAKAAEIAREVSGMKMGWLMALTTRHILRGLRKRAYTREDFMRMIGETPFVTGNIESSGIGFKITLRR
ncbi:MAG TPA: class I SAM-dependent methyltransferase [Micropepsaceae bacterium]|nr:class I SAM-dependent methyltransferase [Micropepsaceae bacterium]